MEYIYAALLLHKAGKTVDEAGIKKILEAAGLQVDETKVKSLVTALSGVDIEKAISEAAIATTSAPVAESKKEDKKEETKAAEAAAEGLSALFG
ncbi:MAG: 50S ribosomal protein L12 [archaeon]